MIDLEKLGKLLRKWREENKLSLRDAEKITVVSAATLSRIENNCNIPDTKTIELLLPHLGITLKDISADQRSYEENGASSINYESMEENLEDKPESQDVTKIQYFEGAHLGSPSPVENEPVDHWNLHEELIGSSQKRFLLRVFGESMIDENIFDRDVLVIERVESSDKVSDGEIILVNIEGEFAVKRYYKNQSTIELRSANVAQESKYKSIFIIPTNEFDQHRVDELKAEYGTDIIVKTSDGFYLWGLVKHLIRRI